MAAANHDLVIEKNATFRRKLIWRDKNRKVVNITGYTALMQIRSSTDSAIVLFELSTENGRIAITGASGSIALTISATDTSTFVFTSGVYDLVLIAPLAASKTRVIEGKTIISPAVSHS